MLFMIWLLREILKIDLGNNLLTRKNLPWKELHFLVKRNLIGTIVGFIVQTIIHYSIV